MDELLLTDEIPQWFLDAVSELNKKGALPIGSGKVILKLQDFEVQLVEALPIIYKIGYEQGKLDAKIGKQMSDEELVGKLEQARKEERGRIITVLAENRDLCPDMTDEKDFCQKFANCEACFRNITEQALKGEE